MDFLQAIIFGVVEGFTEFLPISSTGHLILTAKLLGLTADDFVKVFEVAIQLGAILAVAVLYWKRIISSQNLWKKIAVAFLPTALLGLVFYKLVKMWLGSEAIVLWALFLGGVALIILELFFSRKKSLSQSESDLDFKKLSYPKALGIGLFQSLAMIPGVSRAAATIMGGVALGLSRKAIVEFSFLLAIPTMAAATGLDLIKNAPAFTWVQFQLLAIGFIVSFAVAILGIKFLLSFIQKHNFVWFGVYRITLTLVFWLLVLR